MFSSLNHEQSIRLFNCNSEQLSLSSFLARKGFCLRFKWSY